MLVPVATRNTLQPNGKRGRVGLASHFVQTGERLLQLLLGIISAENFDHQISDMLSN
jgi:hypothetical protein